MKRSYAQQAAVPREPRRDLRTDFTAYTLRSANRAKHRANRKHNLQQLLGENFTMRKLTFLRTVPGATLAVLVVGATSVGAYAAANNWFGGNILANQGSASTITVDVSSCVSSDNLALIAPGFNGGTNPNHLEFKVTGSPHISATDLQNQLLRDCEVNSVVSFYKARPATASDALLSSTTFGGENDELVAGSVKAVSGNTITLSYYSDANGATVDKGFTAAPNATFYDEGKVSSLSAVKAGDTVMFELKNNDGFVADETHSLKDHATALQSIFKTKYDVTQASSVSKQAGALYDSGHIMPIDQYNAVRK